MAKAKQNTPAPEGEGDYGAETITVLKGLDAVRKRPGMYIGDTDDGSGLHHMLYEVVDNCIDEARAGACARVLVMLNANGSVAVEDNGLGRPMGGMHWMGVDVVNVLSRWLDLTIWRGGQEHFMRFSGGVPDAPFAVTGDAGGKQGTRVEFLPSADIFSMTDFDFGTIEHRLRELASMNPGLTIVLSDLRGVEPHIEEMNQGIIRKITEPGDD